MNYVGKIVGGVLGLVMTRHPIGLVTGLAVGHAWDAGLFDYWLPAPGGREGALVAPLFALAGLIAKADGHVSEEDVAITKQLIQRLALQGDSERLAIENFNRGKRGEVDLAKTTQLLRQFCGYNGELKVMLVEVLTDIAYAQGVLHDQARDLLVRIADGMEVDANLIELIVSRKRADAFQDSGAVLIDPYEVLSVAPDASDEEVRLAYRRMMAKFHPDKAMANQETAEDQARAQDRSRQINAAFEQIKLQRNLR